jgi:sulfopyruvate decarboxylase subunit alpha
VSATPDFARDMVAVMKAEKVRSLIHVPDAVIGPILSAAATEGVFEITGVTREEEGFGVMAGHHIGGTRAVLLLQSSGLGNSLNAIGSLVIPFGIACPMIVSLRGEIGDRNVAQVPLGRAIRGILDELGIQSTWITDGAKAGAALQDMLRSAYRWGLPAAAVLTREGSGGIEE